jgi:hypothetical protein
VNGLSLANAASSGTRARRPRGARPNRLAWVLGAVAAVLALRALLALAGASLTWEPGPATVGLGVVAGLLAPALLIARVSLRSARSARGVGREHAPAAARGRTET